MPAMEFLCRIIGVNPARLSKEENVILEAVLFCSLCDYLKDRFEHEFISDFSLMNDNSNRDEMMMEASFIRFIIHDLIRSGEYTMAGIAVYTNIPEEVVYEIAIGKNISPSLYVSRKIIELHKTVRLDLYQEIMRKISADYSGEHCLEVA